MTEITDIDAMAVAGYQYATKTGTSREVPISNDLDLMAFNAGISNANIRHNLTVPKLIQTGVKVSL